MDLVTFDILNYNLPTHFRCVKVFQGPTIFLSNINTDVKYIYPSLNGYKYTMRPLE